MDLQVKDFLANSKKGFSSQERHKNSVMAVVIMSGLVHVVSSSLPPSLPLSHSPYLSGHSLDESSNVLHLSSIFKWFAGDFDPYGGVLKFIAPYIPEVKGFI